MKGLFFVFGMVAAVALAMWLELRDSEKKIEESPKKELVEVLLPVGPEKVQRVRWRNFERGEREVQVERTPQGWQMRAPYLGPADSARIEDLLLTATRLRKAVRLEGVDPQKAGIESEYVAYLEFEGSFGKTRVDIGAALPYAEYGNVLRMRRVGFPSVNPRQEVLFHFPPTLFNTINDFAEHYRDQAISPCPIDQLVSIRLLPMQTSERLELRRDPKLGWIALEPYQGPLEPELMDRLVGRLAGLSFQREAAEQMTVLPEHGFEPPRFVLEFGDGAERQTALELGASEKEQEGMTSGAAAGRFARLVGDFRVRTLSEEALEPLLGPPDDPSATWPELRARALAPSTSSPLVRVVRRGALLDRGQTPLSLEVATNFVMERNGARMLDESGQEVNSAKLVRWLDSLLTLRAQGFQRMTEGQGGAASTSGERAMLSAAFEDGSSITLLLSAPDAEGQLWVDFGDPWLLARLDPEIALRLFQPRQAWN